MLAEKQQQDRKNPYQKVGVHHAPLHYEMYELLVSTVMGCMRPVRQQPLFACANVFFRLSDAILVVIIAQVLDCGVAGYS